jgi:hypothetical protein
MEEGGVETRVGAILRLTPGQPAQQQQGTFSPCSEHQSTTVWTSPGYAFFGQVFAVLICVHIVLQRRRMKRKPGSGTLLHIYGSIRPHPGQAFTCCKGEDRVKDIFL